MHLVSLPPVVIMDIFGTLWIPSILQGQPIKQGQNGILNALPHFGVHFYVKLLDIVKGKIVISHLLHRSAIFLPQVRGQPPDKILVGKQSPPILFSGQLQIFVNIRIGKCLAAANAQCQIGIVIKTILTGKIVQNVRPHCLIFPNKLNAGVHLHIEKANQTLQKILHRQVGYICRHLRRQLSRCTQPLKNVAFPLRRW